MKIRKRENKAQLTDLKENDNIFISYDGRKTLSGYIVKILDIDHIKVYLNKDKSIHQFFTDEVWKNEIDAKKNYVTL